MKTFKEFLAEKLTDPSSAEYDFVHINASVWMEKHPNGPAMKVVKIVDDQSVMIKDEYGNTKRVKITDLVPYKGK